MQRCNSLWNLGGREPQSVAQACEVHRGALIWDNNYSCFLVEAECWATRKWQEAKLHLVEMHLLRVICTVTRTGRIRNAKIKENITTAPVAEKSTIPRCSGRCHRYGHGHKYFTQKRWTDMTIYRYIAYFKATEYHREKSRNDTWVVKAHSQKRLETNPL